MSWLVQVAGVALIFITLADVFLTVLYQRTGKNLISLQLGKGIWRLFCLISCLFRSGKRELLSFSGATVLLTVVMVWVCLLWVGFALCYYPALGSGVQASEGATPTDFAAALYYSGFCLTTLGIGDLASQTPLWRLVTILEAVIGFSIITATMTYLLSVYGALTRRNTFALSLHHRTGGEPTAIRLVLSMKGYGRFETAMQEISNIARELLFLLESHHAYPVLHYFRFRQTRYSLPRISLLSMDLVTLIRTALHPRAYKPLLESAAVSELENGGLDLLFQLSQTFIKKSLLDQPVPEDVWRSWYKQAVETFREHGVETIDDVEAGADEYVTLRSRWDATVVAFAHYMSYSWDEVAPAEPRRNEKR